CSCSHHTLSHASLSPLPPTTLIYTLSLHDALPISAYTMSETALKNYTKKAEEIVGKEKADEIREKAQADAQLAVPQPVKAKSNEIGRAHVCTPVTFRSRMPSSA